MGPLSGAARPGPLAVAERLSESENKSLGVSALEKIFLAFVVEDLAPSHQNTQSIRSCSSCSS